MKAIDWTSFVLRIDIDAPAADIFKMISNQDGIEQWFLEKASFRTKDGKDKPRTALIAHEDTYTWMWHGSDYIGTGEVLENNDEDRIKFTFEGCHVTVEIKPQENIQVVTLTQSRIPTDEASKKDLYMGCSSGWTFYLANLKAVIQGGLDLRNKNKEVKGVIST